MPKLKTKKTLVKRIRVTKTGKIMKKQNNMGHLKVKKSSSAKHRKKKLLQQKNRGHIKVLKRLLAGRGAMIK